VSYYATSSDNKCGMFVGHAVGKTDSAARLRVEDHVVGDRRCRDACRAQAPGITGVKAGLKPLRRAQITRNYYRKDRYSIGGRSNPESRCTLNRILSNCMRGPERCCRPDRHTCFAERRATRLQVPAGNARSWEQYETTREFGLLNVEPADFVMFDRNRYQYAVTVGRV
jgi:hypothetical protein